MEADANIATCRAFGRRFLVGAQIRDEHAHRGGHAPWSGPSLSASWGFQPSETAGPRLVQRGWLVLAVWLIASAAMALNQYYRRRTRLSAAILVAAVIVCFATIKGRYAGGTFPDGAGTPRAVPRK